MLQDVHCGSLVFFVNNRTYIHQANFPAGICHSVSGETQMYLTKNHPEQSASDTQGAASSQSNPIIFQEEQHEISSYLRQNFPQAHTAAALYTYRRWWWFSSAYFVPCFVMHQPDEFKLFARWKMIQDYNALLYLLHAAPGPRQEARIL